VTFLRARRSFLKLSDTRANAFQKRAAEGRTFRECATEFTEKNRAGWRNAKHTALWTATLATYVYPTLGGLLVSEIDAGLVVQALDPIWVEKPDTTSRVRRWIEAMLDAASVCQQCPIGGRTCERRNRVPATRGNPGYRTVWRLSRPHSTSDVGDAVPFHVESGNRSDRADLAD